MKYRVGMVHGVFDILHAGHLWHLRQAAEACDFLVVSLVADKFVTKPGRPIVNERDRRESLLSLRYVTCVLLTRDETPIDNIRAVRPDVWIRGEEYRGRKRPEDAILDELGIARDYTAPLPVTTTSLIERIRETAIHRQ